MDVLARLLAERMAPKMGVNVIVENRAGASGTVGGSHVLQSPPDGYTVLFSSNTHTMSKLVMSNAPYDPLADFTPIARGGEAPLLAVISPNLPQKIARGGRGRGTKGAGQVDRRYALAGFSGHVATLSFNRLTNTHMTITPYRGTAPALTDVAGGHTQMLIDAMVVLLPMAKSGGVRRSPLPRPSAAPRRRISRQRRKVVCSAQCRLLVRHVGSQGHAARRCGGAQWATVEAMRELETSGRLAVLGVEPTYGTPRGFRQFPGGEVQRNGELLKSANFKPQ